MALVAGALFCQGMPTVQARFVQGRWLKDADHLKADFYQLSTMSKRAIFKVLEAEHIVPFPKDDEHLEASLNFLFNDLYHKTSASKLSKLLQSLNRLDEDDPMVHRFVNDLIPYFDVVIRDGGESDYQPDFMDKVETFCATNRSALTVGMLLTALGTYLYTTLQEENPLALLLFFHGPDFF